MTGINSADNSHSNQQSGTITDSRQDKTTASNLSTAQISTKLATNKISQASQSVLTRNSTILQSSKKPPTYTPVVFNSTQERSDFFANLHNSHPNTKIAVINDSSDFSRLNLLSSINLGENDNFTTENGILFSDDPQDELILVLDFCNMDPTSRIEIHQLFDEDARFGNKSLGSNVTIISAVDTNLITGFKANQQDFWRRAGRGEEQSCNKASNAQTNEEFFNDIFNRDSFISNAISAYATDSAYSIRNKGFASESYGYSASTIKEKLTINLANKNWNHELFGGPELDKNGNAIMFPGKLAELKENQEVVLLNAPWHDDNFNNELRRTITQSRYTTNKQTITLPNNISWCKDELTSEQLYKFKQKFNILKADGKQDLTEFNKTAILNNLIFSQCFEKIGIDKNGKLVKHDALEEWLQDADSILITSKLTDSQWQSLLYHLQSLGKEKLPIIQYNIKDQPFKWRADNSIETQNLSKPNTENKNIIKSISLEEYYSKINKTDETNQQEKIVIELTPDINLENLCTDIELKDYSTRTFNLKQKRLLDALQTGKEVVLIGLENNPALARYLEPLLTNSPALMIHGFKNSFNDMKLTVVLPHNEKLQSPAWQRLVPKEPFPQPTIVELQAYARANFNLEPEEQQLADKMVEQLDILVTTINAMLEDNNHFEEKIILNEYLIDKVWNQALMEKKLNNRLQLSIIDFQKSINTVISKSLRQYSELHYCIKALTRNCFVTEQTANFDPERIKNFLTANLNKLTPEFFEKNFWYLLKFYPEISHLTQTKTEFPLEKKAQSKWFIIRVIQAIFDVVVGFLIESVNTLLYLINFKKKKPDYNLTAIPDSIIISMRPNEEYNRILDLAKAVAVNCVDEKDKSAIKLALDVSDKAVEKANECQTNWQSLNTIVETTLRDLVYYTESLGLPAIKAPNSVAGIDDWCYENALEITQIKNSNIPLAKKKQKITNIITKMFPKELLQGAKGATNQEVIVNFLAEPNQDKLYASWDARRHLRLAATTEAAGSVNMLGDAATGKTRAAQKIAKGGVLFIMNASPDASTNDFFGENVAQTAEDGSIIFQFKDNPLTQWAKYRHEDPKSEKPITLLIDEATVLPKGFLEAFILAMKSTPSHISHNGEILPLTKNHRILLAGNRATDEGRTESKILKQLVPTICFKTLPLEYQNNVIIKPKINAIVEKYNIGSNESKLEIINGVNSMLSFLFNTYSKSLPKNYNFTPRDLNECCVLLETYLWKLQQKGELDDAQNISLKQLAPLVERAVQDTISGRIEKDRWKLTAIKGLFKRQFHSDDELNDKLTAKFDIEYDEVQCDFLQQNPSSDIDFHNKIIKSMAYSVWIEMQKRAKEQIEGVAHSGRRCREIKGDAGIGKDMIINIMLQYFQKEFDDKNVDTRVYNAGPTSWNNIIVPEIEKAFNNGGVVSIAELNSIPSSTSEGKLNPLLANDSPKIGSLVFLTNNPTDYAGRNEPTFALNNRMNTLQVGQFDSNDLISICKRVGNKELIDKIVALHCKLTELLIEHQLSPRPSLDQLKRLAEYAKDNPNISDTELLEKFTKIYSFYINTGTKYTNKFTYQWRKFISEAKKGFFNFSSSLVLPKSYQEDLSHWFTDEFSNHLSEATYIMKGTTEDRFDNRNNYIYLSTKTLESNDFEKQQVTAARIFIEKLWCDCGAPVINKLEKQDQEKDNSIFYKLWIQKFAATKINPSEDKPYSKAELLFPISEAEQKKLAAIDDVRKALLASLYKLEPNDKNRRQAEIIFEGAKNTHFTNAVRDITRYDIDIFNRLIQDSKNQIANALLTETLINKNLTEEYLQNLIQIFQTYPEQLNRIIDYLHNNLNYYCTKEKYTRDLSTLINYLKTIDVTQQPQIKDKIDSIIKNFDDYIATKTTDYEDTDFYAETFSSAQEIEATTKIEEHLATLLHQDQEPSKLARFANAAISLFRKKSNLDTDDPQDISQNTLDDIPFNLGESFSKLGLKTSYTLVLKIMGGIEQKYKNNLIPVEARNEIEINGFIHENTKKKNRRFLFFNLDISATIDLSSDNMADSAKKALKFFYKPENASLKNTLEFKIISLIANKDVFSLHPDDMGIEFSDLFKYDDPDVKSFVIKLILNARENLEFTEVIANKIASGFINTAKLPNLLKSLVQDIDSTDYYITRKKKHFKLMHLCGTILDCCLQQLNTNINTEASYSTIDCLLEFEFLKNNLSARGVNALAGILKHDIPVFKDKIKAILDERIKCSIDRKLDIDNNIPKNFKKVQKGIEYITLDYEETSTEEDKFIKLTTDKLAKTNSKHMQEYPQKFTSFKKTFNWNSSETINLSQYIRAEPWYEHDKKHTIRSENIFVTSFPVMINPETFDVFYHKASGKIINFAKLVQENKDFIPDSEIVKLLMESGVSADEAAKDSFAVWNYLAFKRGSTGRTTKANYFSKAFVHIPPEEISKAIYNKMLDTFGSLTFCISSSDSNDNGFVTVTNHTEIQAIINKFVTRGNRFSKSFHGLDNAEYHEHIDNLIKKQVAEQDNNAAVFTVAEMQKIAHEMFTQINTT